MLSFKTTADTIAPVADEIIKGIKADTLISAIITSMAKSTPAMGALNAAAIPDATPQANNKVLSL